jgi:hypothetical protein
LRKGNISWDNNNDDEPPPKRLGCNIS